MTEMDYQVVLALLQQSQEDFLGLRKQLAAHDSSALQGSMDRMQASMDDMLKTLRATQTSLKQTQVALNEATDQNRKLSSEMVKYMESYMDERRRREALESEILQMKKLLKLYQSNGSASEQVKIIKGKHFGRSNFVGFGSHQGAGLGACAYTFVETCKLNTISAYEYIKKVLTLIGDEKEDTNDYSALLPSVLAVK